jgi:hypothetical protein
MVKIRNSHRKLINEPLKSRAEFHFERMNGNATYAAYQPQMTELGTLFAPFGTAISNCKLGGTDRTEAKNKIQRDIMDILNDVSRKLEGNANAKGVSQEEGENLIKGAGFDLAEVNKGVSTKKVVTNLDVPTGLKATDEKKQGFVALGWDEQEDAITYLIQDLDANGYWNNVGVSEEPFVILSGFPSNAARSFRIASISTGRIMSDYSAPVTVWIS